MKKRIVNSLIISLLLILTVSSTVLAVPDNVTGVVANPSNTSIILSWQPATGATSYLVRYRTDTYPTGTGDGTLGFNGTFTMATISSLSAGQTYYFSVWGYDGASYSPIGTTFATTTLAAAIPNGAQINADTVISIPTIPANATQTPVITQFNLAPFNYILSYSNNSSYGGLGMPIANLWETSAIIIIVLLTLFTYIKLKNFFIAYMVMLVLSFIGVGIHLVQGYIIPLEIIIGLGVWALERFFQ